MIPRVCWMDGFPAKYTCTRETIARVRGPLKLEDCTVVVEARLELPGSRPSPAGARGCPLDLGLELEPRPRPLSATCLFFLAGRRPGVRSPAVVASLSTAPGTAEAVCKEDIRTARRCSE